MNTGMGDAVDLGWKLAASVAGWGAPGLLGSYEAERRPVAQRNVGEATDNVMRTTVVRPDGHVAWRATIVPPDPLKIIDTIRGA